MKYARKHEPRQSRCKLLQLPARSQQRKDKRAHMHPPPVQPPWSPAQHRTGRGCCAGTRRARPRTLHLQKPSRAEAGGGALLYI